MCCHEIKLHGQFLEDLYPKQHFRRSRVRRSFDGCEEVTPDVLDDILRHNECSDLLETQACNVRNNEYLWVENDVNFVMHSESKKPNHVIGRKKTIRPSAFTQHCYHSFRQIHRVA